MLRRSLVATIGAVGCIVFAGLGLGACSAILGDFDVLPAGADAGGGGGDGSNQQGDGSPIPGSDGSIGPDGSLTCAEPTGDCDGNTANGCETDLRTTAAHCGKCGRDCGAAGCDNGDCKAEQLAANLSRPFGLELAGPRIVWHQGDAIYGCRIVDCAASKAILVDVTGLGTALPNGINSPRVIAAQNGSFFFSQCPGNQTNDCSIARCDIAGCKLTGATYLNPASGWRRASLVVGVPGAIYTHHGIDGFIRYNLPSGPFPFEGSKWKIFDQLQAFHLDPMRTVWVDDNASMANPTGGVFLCPAAGCTGNPTRLLPPPVRHLDVKGSLAFTSSGAASGSSIVSCDVGGCGSAGTLLASNQAYVGDIAADADAVYWSTVGAQNFTTNTAAVGAILRCNLPDCPKGPKKIAENILNPTSVRIDDTHVYWVERGHPAQTNGVVMRRRR